MISTFAGSALTYSTGHNVAATSSGFGSPAGVVGITSNGNIAVSDSQANNVRLVVVSTGIIYNLAGTGSSSPSPTSNNGDGGMSTSATLSFPVGLTEALGFILTADRYNNKIRRIYTTANIITLKAGEIIYCFLSLDCFNNHVL
jgi:hypothetical protein